MRSVGQQRRSRTTGDKSRRPKRVVAAGIAAIVALALASGAFAFAPSIVVSTATNGVTTMGFSQAASDTPVQAVTYYVPYQYIAPFGQTTGFSVGTATAKVVLTDSGGSTVTATGTVDGAVGTDPVTVGGVATTVAAAATACTGAAAHFSLWVVNLSVSGQTLSIPIYIDPVLASSNLSDLYAYTITYCLAPSVAGAAGRAPGGARIIDLQLVLPDALSISPGWYSWDSISTAFAANGTRDTANRAEAQSIDRVGAELTGTAKSAGGKIAVAGRLTQGNAGVAAQTVTVSRAGKVIGKLTTTKAGRFTGKVAAGKGPLRLQANVPTRSSACVRPWFAPSPCSGLTVGGFAASLVVRVGR